MERITDKHLLAAVDRINRICGTPATPYTRHADGSFTPNANCYHLDYAYGGVNLVQMSNISGCSGVSTPLGGGHLPKRELYGKLHAFINGMEAAKMQS